MFQTPQKFIAKGCFFVDMVENHFYEVIGLELAADLFEVCITACFGTIGTEADT